MFEHHHVAVDVVEHLRLQHEERAVDPAFGGLGFFLEGGHLVAVEAHMAVARRGPHRGDRRELAVAAVEGDQLVDVDIRHPVAPGQHEGLVAEPGFQPLDPAPGQGFIAGFDEVHRPVRDLRRLAPAHPAAPGLDRQISRQRAELGEVSLDVVALVSQRDHEFVEAVMGIDLHDVPQDRASADLDHRLGTDDGFFNQTRSLAPRENCHFHVGLPLILMS